VISKVENVGKESPRISLIIPVDSFDSDLTARCIQNLRSNDRSDYRIVLVESKGDDFAYGRSVNYGVRFTEDSEFIAVMDSDTFIKSRAIENAAVYLTKNPAVGLCGAWISRPKTDEIDHVGFTHLNSTTRFLWNSIKRRAPFYAIRRILRGNNWSYGVLGVPRYVPGKMVGVSSAFCAMRRECYEQVGPWDESYRSSFVDVDYSFRVMLSERWFVSSAPNVRVMHYGQITKKRYGHGDFEGLDAYLKKWPRHRIEEVLDAAARGKFLIPSTTSLAGNETEHEEAFV